jgi:hypothetical protein
MALDIRPIRTQEELSEAKALLAPDALEPEWVNAFVLMDGEKVGGLFCPAAKVVGTSVVLEIEPMHITRPGAASLLMIGWMDAHLRHIAAANGLKGYTFSTSNLRLQTLCEKYLPVTVGPTEDSARRYFRVFT